MSLWLLPRGQLISIRYCGFIACSLLPGPLIDSGFLRPRRCPTKPSWKYACHQLELRFSFSDIPAANLVLVDTIFGLTGLWLIRGMKEERKRGDYYIIYLEYYFSRMMDSFFFLKLGEMKTEVIEYREEFYSTTILWFWRHELNL